jgi:hypothetical protein
MTDLRPSARKLDREKIDSSETVGLQEGIQRPDAPAPRKEKTPVITGVFVRSGGRI